MRKAAMKNAAKPTITEVPDDQPAADRAAQEAADTAMESHPLVDAAAGPAELPPPPADLPSPTPPPVGPGRYCPPHSVAQRILSPRFMG